MESNIKQKIKRGKVIVEGVETSQYGQLQAHVTQVVKKETTYPQKQISNDMQDNPFGIEDFGEDFKGKPYESEETRHAWIAVPEGSTKESVQKILDEKYPNCCLYRVLDNDVPLSTNRRAVINDPEFPDTTKDTFAEKYVLRYPKNHEKAGEICLDSSGKVQYRVIYYSNEFREDEDNRNPDPEYVYTTDTIEEELEMMKEGQQVPVQEL